MIFITTTAVTPEYVKKTLKFNGSDVVRINFKYPSVKAIEKINDFYAHVVKNFMKFCENNLYKSAAVEFTANENNGFKPFGAVMSFETEYNKQDCLCIHLDIDIYAGEGCRNAARKSHVWDLSNGDLIPYYAPD